jgi:hypothetical protein
MVMDGRQGQDGAAKHGPAGPEQQTQEDDRFKRNVGGEEVGDGGADPDAKSQRNENERKESEGLAGRSALGKEQPPEGSDPREHAGYRSDHAHFHQERDPNEVEGHVFSVTQDRDQGSEVRDQGQGLALSCQLCG